MSATNSSIDRLNASFSKLISFAMVIGVVMSIVLFLKTIIISLKALYGPFMAILLLIKNGLNFLNFLYGLLHYFYVQIKTAIIMKKKADRVAAAPGKLQAKVSAQLGKVKDNLKLN